MKKWIIAFVCALLFATPALAGEPVVSFVTGASGLGDLSFNDMAYGGIRRAQLESSFKLVILEPKNSGESTEEDVRGIVEQSDIIILLGAQHIKFAKEAARSFPDKQFITFEVPLEGYDNISSVMFNHHEGAFLAGALAAMFSRSKKIGFCGGVDIAVIKAFRTGFFEGANHITDDIEIVEEYISTKPDFSGFNNPQKAYEKALKIYDNGVDVIFAAAGSSGNGVIQAAKNRQLYVIGVDSNQDHMAKGYVLTSVMKRLDTAVYSETVNAYLNDFH